MLLVCGIFVDICHWQLGEAWQISGANHHISFWVAESECPEIVFVRLTVEFAEDG